MFGGSSASFGSDNSHPMCFGGFGTLNYETDQLRSLNNLPLHQLITIDETNEVVAQLKHRFSRKIVVIQLPNPNEVINNGIKETDDVISFSNFGIIPKILQRFGHLISNLKIDYNSESWSPQLETISGLVNLYCLKTLKQFHVKSLTENFFDHFPNKFVAVENVTLEGVFNYMHIKYKFSELFPSLQQLSVEKVRISMPNSMDCIFPHLNRTSVKVHFDKENRYVIEGVLKNTKGGWTSLHFESEKGNESEVKSLIDSGADVNARCDDGKAPLHISVENSHAKVAKVLIDNNADVNAKDNEGSTPILLAAKIGHEDTTKVLIEGKADLIAVDNNGKNAIQIALNNDHENIAKMVIDDIRDERAIDFAVAIDFTSSNGDPMDESSLHYLHGNRDNHYEMVFRGVGELIKHYGSSELFLAYGFGADLPDQIKYKFPLNDNIENPYCSGVDDILKCYQNKVRTVELYGPTHYAPVIENMVSIERNLQKGKNYFVLLIITDGELDDVDETKRAITEASKYPISIIIVTVGDSDLDNLEKLLTNVNAKRNILTIFSLNKFLTEDGTKIKCEKDFAQEVYSKIPEQMKTFN